MSNKVILKQSNCYKNCNDVNCDATTPNSIFGLCDFNGTINLISLKEESGKIVMILEIDISNVDFSLYVINKTIEKSMEFTVISNNGSKYEGSFTIAFLHQMNFPFIDGKFSYQLTMPSYEILKLNYNIEHECMFSEVKKVGPQQCNQEVNFKFEKMNSIAKELKWHKGYISVEFKLSDH